MMYGRKIKNEPFKNLIMTEKHIECHIAFG